MVFVEFRYDFAEWLPENFCTNYEVSLLISQTIFTMCGVYLSHKTKKFKNFFHENYGISQIITQTFFEN